MSMVSARVGAVGAIACAVFAFCPPPIAASAFGLHLGPLHLDLPFSGFHRHGRIARSEPAPSARGEPSAAGQSAQNASPVLLYPILAWPSLYDDIFPPNTSATSAQQTSSWPFGYENIFDQAFAKYPPERSAELCPYRDASAEIVMRIERQTGPNAEQKPLLEKLAAALGQANGYLMHACPKEIPLRPIARLQLMEGQTDAMIMALEIVRPPLQKFEQSLDEQQRARWNGSEPAANSASSACDSKTEKAESGNWPLSQLEQAVQPNEAQRKELANVQDAFNRAASGLAADCSAAVAPSALGRLEAIEQRLDATWRALQTIEVALANFQKDLSDEQKARINALEIASAR
jgi:LTXXQ motif family protein